MTADGKLDCVGVGVGWRYHPGIGAVVNMDRDRELGNWMG